MINPPEALDLRAMRNLNIIFMGTADFAVPSLNSIHESRHSVIAVVTGPDQPKGRGQKLAFTPVKRRALEFNLPILQPITVKDPSFAEQVRNLNPDLIVVVAFKILPPAVFEIPAYGSVNLHASLLPKYRGAAPLNWALINGDTETGVTTFFLQSKVDTGEMLVQRRIPVLPEDDAGTLHDKLALLGAETLLDTIHQIADEQTKPVKQDESGVSVAPKIFKDTCHIDWTKPAEQIHNLVRGLSPYPAAFTEMNGITYKIFKTTVSTTQRAGESGTISVVDPKTGIAVVCGDHREIWIKELQPPSKKRMTSQEFLRGYSIQLGDRFQ